MKYRVCTLLTAQLVSCLLLPIRSPAQSTVPWSAIDMGFVVSSSSTPIVKSLVGQGFVGTIGMHMYRLRANDFVSTKRMLVLK
jgi:hypothetical protein